MRLIAVEHPRVGMSDDLLPDFMYAGTAKAASTWIYQCLRAHPEILMPEEDTVNYFNINYHQSEDWYREHFAAHDDERFIGEASTGYLEYRATPERIATDIPEAKLLFCLRNPVERAYSQWWHGRSNGYTTYEFEEIFESHPRFLQWAEPGFYDYHIGRFANHFPEEQIKIVFFDDLRKDELSFIQNIYAYIGADEDFVPPQVGETVNEADFAGFSPYVRVRDWIRKEAPDGVENAFKLVWDPIRGLIESRDEYEQGMDPEIRRQLEAVFVDDVRALEARTGRSLDHWFEYETL